MTVGVDLDRTNRQTMRGRWRSVVAISTASMRADPVRTVASMVLDTAQGAAGPLLAVGTGMLVNAVVHHARAGGFAAAVGVLGASTTTLLVLGIFADRVRLRLEENVAHHVEIEVMGMVTGLPGIAHHENPAHLHRIDRLLEESWLIAMAVPALVSTVEIVARFGLTIALLAAIDRRLSLLPLAILPALWAGVAAEGIRLRALEARAEVARSAEDLSQLAAKPESAGELRAAGAGRELVRLHGLANAAVARDEFRHRMRGGWRQAIAQAVFAGGFGLGLLAVAQRAAAGRTSIGGLVVVIGLAGQIIGQAASVTGRLNWINWALTGVRHYAWLLRYDRDHRGAPGTAPAPDRLVDGISFDGVSFSYPGAGPAVLDKLDLHLPAGSVVAIVGDNGAGKTTIIKLLLRFYEPTEGRITVDGVPLADLDVEDWRRHVTAALQEHTRPELVLREAIGIGELEALDDPAAVDRAAALSGAEDVVSALPDGLSAQLGVEWPGGTELSGGQWQRLAVARSAMRTAPLVLVLDEPTAALDPLAEHALFEHYAGSDAARKARGAVTVVISHRLSTVRMADHIVVLEGGRIAESGSHAQLLAHGGRYAELFTMQAAAYQ